ncbi:protein DOG1-like 4 [Ricinus communis]|nr:protein DOG1-like 4 [Ricinus communis]|eukprot:XP_002534284.2 protein DOG1-like 4 [Ricinus communis]
MKNKVEDRFSEFLEKWMRLLDGYLLQLRKVVSSKDRLNKHGTYCDEKLQAIVSKVAQHYKEYYIIKWALAHEDVLAFFSPTWISPLETASSWITDWKPSVVFKLVDSLRTNHRVPGPSSTLAELTQEQVRKIEELKLKIRLEEQKVEREMERQQVAIADRKMVELARWVYRVKNDGKVSQVEGLVQAALNGALAGLEKVMKAADCVRLRALKGILDVLSPFQCVEFLAATAMLHIQLRQWGKRRHNITNNC